MNFFLKSSLIGARNPSIIFFSDGDATGGLFYKLHASCASLSSILTTPEKFFKVFLNLFHGSKIQTARPSGDVELLQTFLIEIPGIETERVFFENFAQSRSGAHSVRRGGID